MANKTDPYAYCNYSEATKYLNEAAYWNTYAVFMPCCFVLGFVGRSLSLLAFHHQAKEESAYLFQIFLAAVELFQVFSFTWYGLTRYLWSGVAKMGQAWFMKCWFCMYLDAHLHTQGQGFLCSLILSLFMTCDRIFALAKPARYNKIKNRKTKQLAVFIFSIFISVFTVLPGAFYFMPVWNEAEGMYHNEYNKPWRNFLVSLLNGTAWLELIVTISLIVSTFVLALIYRDRMKKRQKLITAANKKEEEANMQKARTLFWLTFIQATLDIIAVGGAFSYNMISWLTQNWPNLGDDDCISNVIAPFTDGIRALFDMGDPYLVFALMPSFRKIVIKSAKSILKVESNKVIIIGAGSGTVSGTGARHNACFVMSLYVRFDLYQYWYYSGTDFSAPAK